MSEDQKKQLETQLWNIANTLRGKMNADEFRDYILDFIFYKYLSERMKRRRKNHSIVLFDVSRATKKSFFDLFCSKTDITN